jgi:hypothetical protein
MSDRVNRVATYQPAVTHKRTGRPLSRASLNEGPGVAMFEQTEPDGVLRRREGYPRRRARCRSYQSAVARVAGSALA